MQPRKIKKRISYKVQLFKSLHPKAQVLSQIEGEWLNKSGKLCKAIQLENKCFCGHKLKEHTLDSVNFVRCKDLKCKCSHFEYMPTVNMKCICKHSYTAHRNDDKKCSQCEKYGECFGFISEWNCQCADRYLQHHTVFREIASNRENVGLPKLTTNHTFDQVLEVPVNRLFVQLKSIQNNKQAIHKGIKKREDRLEMEAQNFHSNEQMQESMEELKRRKLLKQANQRYQMKFNELHENENLSQINITNTASKNKFDVESGSALELYIKPHYYTKVSLSKVIDLQINHSSQSLLNFNANTT